jgi:ribosomal protein L7/L12
MDAKNIKHIRIISEWLLIKARNVPEDIKESALQVAYQIYDKKCDFAGVKVDSAFVDEVKDCLKNGQRIQAIKLVRVETGMTLKEAKNTVDKICNGEIKL